MQHKVDDQFQSQRSPFAGQNYNKNIQSTGMYQKSKLVTLCGSIQRPRAESQINQIPE